MTWLNTRRLPVLLAAATLIPAVVLVWLGVRLLQQDRELDRQRQRERLEVAAGRVALEIDRRLQDLEAELVAGHGIRLHEGGIEPAADGPILFQPADGPAAPPTPAEIATIEVEEFQRRNLTAAEAAYRRVSTSRERTVTLPQGIRIPFLAGPRWFPDARSVLVLADDPQGTGRVFYRVNIETGASERLHRINQGPSSFALAPDGRSIYWCVQSTTSERAASGVLMRYDITESRETVLKQGEWFIAVAVSPDGTQLAYLRSVRTDEERRKKEYPSVVEVMPVAGGPARQVFRDAIWLTGHRYNTLAWTPDGRSLMFVRDDGLLWRVPVSGGNPEQIGISINGRIKNPAIHPDGKRIVFSAGQADDNEVWALENFLPGLN